LVNDIKGIIKKSVDKEKAKSIFKMAKTNLEMIKTIDTKKYPSQAVKEYYEVIREFMSIILLLDGFRTIGENAHKNIIDYIKVNYKDFTEYEIAFADKLRIIRNEISYNGFFVQIDFIKRNDKTIHDIIKKLISIVNNKFRGVSND